MDHSVDKELDGMKETRRVMDGMKETRRVKSLQL